MKNVIGYSLGNAIRYACTCIGQW